MHKCIYCLEEKEDRFFNKEHVVPRMMGTYNNGLVLSHKQVCESCNSFFRDELENKLDLDSFEAWLRIQYRTKRLANGTVLRNQRIKIIGAESTFKDLPFDVIADSTNPYGISLNPEPLIGILKDGDNHEYEFFKVEDLPIATAEVIERLKASQSPIINTGVPVEIATSALLEKGYPISEYSQCSALDLYDSPMLLANVNLKIDPLVRRLCAKTAFNYLCHYNGAEFVLNEKFDEIRKYIRYGIWSDNLWFRYTFEPMKSVDLSNAGDNPHIVGCLLYAENNAWSLCGSVTWFGKITYTIGLSKDIMPIIPNLYPNITSAAIFNNDTREIEKDESIFIYCD